MSNVEQKNYIIAPEEIQRSDVADLFNNIQVVPNTTTLFPQADKFERIVDLLSLLQDKDLLKDEITENYQFDTRQTQYYVSAGQYLGLIGRYRDLTTKDITFCLTNEGRTILTKRHKAKYMSFIAKILEHEVFYHVFKLSLDKGEIPSKDEICTVMSQSNLAISSTTIERRSSTVRGWIDWIWSQIKD